MRSSLLTAVRLLLGFTLAFCGLWAFANTERIRAAEAGWSEWVVGPLVGGGTFHRPGSSVFFVGVGGENPAGLDVTLACSSAAFAAVGLVLTGLLVSLARSTASHSLLALAAALGIVSFVNIGRLVILAWSVDNWGFSSGFEWAHLYGGSLVSMVAIVLACAVYLMLLRRPTRI